jgi:hypothetical protein
MNEYDTQAKEFLESTGSTLTKQYKEHAKYFGDDDQPRDVYTVRLMSHNGRYVFTFGCALAGNFSDYSILACLDGYGICTTFEEFCSEYGNRAIRRRQVSI